MKQIGKTNLWWGKSSTVVVSEGVGQKRAGKKHNGTWNPYLRLWVTQVHVFIKTQKMYA